MNILIFCVHLKQAWFDNETHNVEYVQNIIGNRVERIGNRVERIGIV